MNQAGSGYSYYAGSRYQRGHNWFGRLFRSGILPLIKYIGKKTVKTGANVLRDTLQGTDLKTAAKKHIKETVGEVTDDAIDKFTQKGSGKRGVKRKAKPLKKPAKKPAKKRKLPGRPRKKGRPKKSTVKRRTRELPPWEK